VVVVETVVVGGDRVVVDMVVVDMVVVDMVVVDMVVVDMVVVVETVDRVVDMVEVVVAKTRKEKRITAIITPIIATPIIPITLAVRIKVCS
jgi:hypothetical protein